MEQPWNGVILQCAGLAGGQGGLSEPQQVDREDYQSRDKHSGQADSGQGGQRGCVDPQDTVASKHMLPEERTLWELMLGAG